jgi:SAM-dependent methyltransferase
VAEGDNAPFTGTAAQARMLNQAFWDERVALHLASDLYDLAGFRAHRDRLRPFEIAEVGEVTGRRLAHLQCHFGMDTLSWAARGAQVSGLDFAPAAIEAARRLAAELELPARFVVADVLDAPAALGAAAFDIVYTGFGALVWLDDLRRWADAVAALLVPGGFLYLAEFHPVAAILDETEGVRVVADYFGAGPRRWETSGSYADRQAPTTANSTVQHEHTLGEVVSAVAGAGLRVEFLHEHPVTLFPRSRNLRRGADGLFRTPAGTPQVPMSYTMRAAKPPA